MSDTHLPISSTDDLQFATAEPVDASASATAPGLSCVACHQPISDVYYALGDQPICPECREAGLAAPAGSGLWRLAKASALGLAAGLVGALIWCVIRRVTNLEIGLVAVLVGMMVGGAVRKGSGGMGGRGYQVLAVLLTYFCIAVNYVPDILEAAFKPPAAKAPAVGERAGAGGVAKPNADPVVEAEAAPGAPRREVGAGEALLALVFLAALIIKLALMLPFLGGAQNVIGLLIIGFALWEAWKINARRPPPISGPYRIGAAPAT